MYRGQPFRNGGVAAADDPARNSAVESPAARSAIALTIIVPTRNESEGVGALLARLATCAPANSEVLFVDDSDDATAYQIRCAAEADELGFPVRLLHRPAPQRDGGLGGAVVAGMRRARGEYVVVIDSDLQHPPEVIAQLLATAKDEALDVVVASRYAGEGSDAGLPTATRRLISRSCVKGLRTIFPQRLREVTDPLSGFFLVRRAAVDIESLRPQGFKILLEILCRCPDLRVGQVGFIFEPRRAGGSKASLREGRRLAAQTVRLRTALAARAIPRQSFTYDVHGLATVRSEQVLPELEKFAVESLRGPATINVRVSSFSARREDDLLIDLTEATPKIRYAESMRAASFVVEVETTADRTNVGVSAAVAASPHVLYTNVVEPLLRWRLVETGHAFVHAACFTDGEHAFLITARTDTGKTTTMLKLLAQGGYNFVSDDLVIVDPTGKVMTYPKPLTISNHTVHALNGADLDFRESLFLPIQSRLHSRGGRKFAFFMIRSGLPVASINGVVQRVIPPPKYHVERLVPGVASSQAGQLTGMVVIERGPQHTEALDHADALEILLANCEDAFGFPPYADLERLLLGMDGQDLRGKERDIISAALDGAPAHLMRSSTLGWAEDIPSMLDSMIAAKEAGRSPVVGVASGDAR